MKINMKQWAQSITESDQRTAIPIMTHPGIEIIGKTVKDAVTDGTVHYQAVKALSEKFPGAAAVTVIMDLTVEAEAFGAKISFSDNEVPSVTERLVSDAESVQKLEVPSLSKGRISQYLAANRLIAENIAKPVFGGCIGPYSLAGRLFDMSEIMMAIYIEPHTIKDLLQKCTDFILSYCQGIKQQGANGIILAEPAAGLLSNDDCRQFSSIYVKQIVDKLQDENFMVVLHNCGNTGHCTDAMVYTGAAGFHFGNQIDMVNALAACPPEALVMGNLDPVSMFKMASAQEIYESTMRLLEATRSYRNFVISSGCDVPPHAPFENIDAFYRAINDYNTK